MENDFLKLSDIPTGGECFVVKVHGYGSFRNRLMELGFVKGKKVKVIKNAPLHDPIEYEIMDSHISLRRSECRYIEVVQKAGADEVAYNGTIEDDFDLVQEVDRLSKNIEIALVGNPNCGKTSLFNRLTGLHEKVGNYSGVTVDAKFGSFKFKGYDITLIDLPGTYSITEYTPEEVYVRKFIAEQHPDIVMNVVDASNLSRNLYLTTQLLDMNISMVMALNMFDEISENGDKLNYDYFGHLIGVPMVPTIASKGDGVVDLLDTVIEVYEGRSAVQRHIHINYGQDIEEAISKVKSLVVTNKTIIDEYTPRFVAMKLLENDKLMIDTIKPDAQNFEQIMDVVAKQSRRLENIYNDDPKSIITNAKYGFVDGALKEVYESSHKDKRKNTSRIDAILTNKWLGIPCLLVFMWITFQATFTLGNYPMEWIESLVSWIGDVFKNILPNGILSDLISDGIIAGVGGVIVFLPNILILFFFISIMEDTGYMSRAAFIMDRAMHKIGLHGKSFIPLLIGFGCNVPAVMATRTLESRRDRIMTMVIIPFMSCSARLPIFILFVSVLFKNNQGLVLLSIYLIGILIGILTSLMLKHTVFSKVSDPFVMELPPYRIPTLRSTLIHMWEKSKQYLKKMGTIILFASILIWALGYFPLSSHNSENRSEQMEESYIGMLGKTIEPVMAPLGFDWKMSVSIMTGFAAKEIVVSSMGILYNGSDSDENLAQEISEQRSPDGSPFFTPVLGFSFMIFVLIYFPCVATIVAIGKEGGRKWAIFTMLYSTTIAWLLSFFVYNIGKLF